MPEQLNNTQSRYHFSFLRDAKVHGIYLNNLRNYTLLYPFMMKKEHSCNFYTVLFFTQDNGIININNTRIHAAQDSVCLISPNQLHSFEELSDLNGWVLFFCQDFYVEEFSFIRLLNIFSCTSQVRNRMHGYQKLNTNEFMQLFDVFELIQKEYEGFIPAGNSVYVLRSLLNILLIKISDLFDCRNKNSFKSESILIHELSRMIDSHFLTEHNTGFYSDAFHSTSKQMNEVCNRNFNCGLKKILTDRLMQEARKMLTSTEMSVSEISYKLRFEDNSYFNKVFKKETGLTPGRFRLLHKSFLP